MNAVLPCVMKLLPFEKAARVERRECPRCHGTGVHSGGECYSCLGWGYLPTAKGRELLTSVAALIGGNAAFDSKGRFDETQLRTVLGGQVRAGMQVRPRNDVGAPFRIVRFIKHSPSNVGLTFDAGLPWVVSDIQTVARELTEDENERADFWLLQHRGKGAVEA